MIKTIVACFLSMGCFTGCAHMASLSNFPEYSKIRFDSLSADGVDPGKSKSWWWTCQSEYAYFAKVTGENESTFVDKAKRGLADNGFGILRSDGSDSMIIGKREMRANEWETIAVVYWKSGTDGILVYARAEITQDFTCGWYADRTKPIIEALCSQTKGCSGRKAIYDMDRFEK
ncbi:MAG: hypothetical protein JWO30_1540 [Fibrobacteres bacterium]|nr:hypothetical protein [Fibrobacterota bacterium]